MTNFRHHYAEFRHIGVAITRYMFKNHKNFHFPSHFCAVMLMAMHNIAAVDGFCIIQINS